MSIDLGAIELYCGPSILGGPDDLDAVIRAFIGEATETLLIAVQELDSRPIAEAILAAKKAGVRIQLILEGDYLVQDPPLADPWAVGGDHEQNRVIHAALLRAGVDVITDLNPKIFRRSSSFVTPESQRPQCLPAPRILPKRTRVPTRTPGPPGSGETISTILRSCAGSR